MRHPERQLPIVFQTMASGAGLVLGFVLSNRPKLADPFGGGSPVRKTGPPLAPYSSRPPRKSEAATQPSAVPRLASFFQETTCVNPPVPPDGLLQDPTQFKLIGTPVSVALISSQ